MSLRIKIFLLPALAIAAAAALVAFGAVRYARRQSEQAGQQRAQTLTTQFQREMAQRGEEVARTVQTVADGEAALRMALDLTRTQADPSIYANDARGLAKIYQLDFLELTAADGSLISSSTWRPASGYHNDWVAGQSDWSHQDAFLGRIPSPDKAELGLLAVRTVRVNDRDLYVIGGRRFDREFLHTLAVPGGMHALLYANLEPQFVAAALTGAEGPIDQADDFAPMIEALQRGESLQPQKISSLDQGGAETFISVPLLGRGGERLGALLIGSSQQDVAGLVKYTRLAALLAAGLGVLFSLALSWWTSAGVSRPLAQPASAAGSLPSAKPAVRQDAGGRVEANKHVADALSESSGQLSRDRERLVQRERVATRREMARRFARDLKESIFPLHMAAEELVDAREETSERFDEIFFECSTSMRAEIDRLKNVAARFGEFGGMPRPRLAPVNINEIARAALQSIEPQFRAAGRPPVTPEVHLVEPDPIIEADSEMLRAALENLLLHCLDAMPSGGALAVRTREKNSVVEIEVSAQGASLSAEDCQRLFVPAGTAPEGMTGLGLATAEAVVSDIGGRISAESTPGTGTSLRLEFAAAPSGRRPARAEPARQAQSETTRQAQGNVVQQASAETTRQAPAENVQPAPPAAAMEPPAELPVEEASAEAVPVTVLATETAATSEEAPTTPEAPELDQTSNSGRPWRGLTFTG